MADKNPSDALSEKHQVTLVLRLLLDRNNRLLHGDVVDVSGQSLGHFSDLESLTHAIEDWLARGESSGG